MGSTRASESEGRIWDEVEEIPSRLEGPDLHVTADSLRAHFESDVARARAPLRNPHLEDPLDESTRDGSKPASVLIPLVPQRHGLAVLLTRRDPRISFGGHISFPGGRADLADESPLSTALREAEEEIGLPPSSVEVLGQLGDYTTKSGFAISTFVGLVAPGSRLIPAPGEVAEILEIPLHLALCSSSYRLARHHRMPGNAIYFLQHEQTVITGPTLSLLVGLYEELQKTHA